jgi:cytochrome P450
VSFGGGVHYCVGAPLALVELDVALRAFAWRISSFAVVADDLERVPSLVFRGVKHLPISVAA